ncbi:transposase [Sunxiuqinia elliptica]|uniref:Transposase IS200 family protein n=1 Tax=Sunxiuqinia elliptica TaxID=655355 RepID=A0A4R6GT35_9BACT|nr:transposase [Sunxiuqinia elliptica]TDN98357.1 transposase IS200 family protein [Sunxiuqinia elliptica]TDO60462.1 transposase IS200 family protein [Sunxiuqinia elliptica]
MSIPPLEHNHFYHIYNRGINSCNLFQENTNYEYFLSLYAKYISPVANTYAWVLMRNHFHLLVKIKGEDEIQAFFQHLQGIKNLEGLKGTNRTRVNQQFSNLFNAYTKAYNKRYSRTGSLFEHPFRRIKIESNAHLKYLVYYIHHNPIHHGFCEHFLEYPWSSYLSMLSPKTTNLKRAEVLEWYRNKKNLVQHHTKEQLEKYNDLKIERSNDW